MNGSLIGYVRIYVDPLDRPQWGNFGPFWDLKMGFFDNFYKISPIYLGLGTCVI